jgi:hypothetical protein
MLTRGEFAAATYTAVLPEVAYQAAEATAWLVLTALDLVLVTATTTPPAMAGGGVVPRRPERSDVAARIGTRPDSSRPLTC